MGEKDLFSLVREQDEVATLVFDLVFFHTGLEIGHAEANLRTVNQDTRSGLNPVEALHNFLERDGCVFKNKDFQNKYRKLTERVDQLSEQPSS